MSSLLRRLRPGEFIRSVSILAGGAATGQLITVAISPLLSRLFGAESFGILAVYTAILGVATVVGSLRLEQAIGLPRSRQASFNVLILAIFASLMTTVIVGVVVLAAPGLLFRDNQNIPTLIVWLFPLGVALSSIYQALGVWALRLRSFGTVARTRVTQSIVGAVVQIGTGLAALGAVGLVAGHIIGQSAGVTTLLRETLKGRRFRRPRTRELLAALSRYRNFPLMATPAALFNSLSSHLPILLLTPIFGAAVAGQYFLASRIVLTPLTLVGGSIGQVFYADATAIGRANPRQLARLVLLTSAKSLAIGLVPVITLAILAPPLFPVIFGSEWGMAGRFGQELCIMLVANFAMSPVTQIFLIIERQFFSIIINAVRLIAASVSIGLPAALGATPEITILTYSITMATYYLATLATALLLLRLTPDRTTGMR